MTKHFVSPATAEQIGRTLGVTREDREVVEKILRDLGEYETEPPAAFKDPGQEQTSSGYKAPGKEK
jgi:hypothetical protein